MKKCFLYLLMVGGLGACIQSEPLNAEADITACKILNAKGLPETNIISFFNSPFAQLTMLRCWPRLIRVST